MSGSQSTGKVLGASTSLVGGIAVLPNTSGSTTLSIIAIIAIITGSAVLISLIGTQLYKKLSK